MNIQDVKIGQTVVRSKGDYVVGRTGDVLEIDAAAGRARVYWEACGKTWVKLDAIEPAATPYEIIDGYYDAKRGKVVNPKYVRL